RQWLTTFLIGELNGMGRQTHNARSLTLATLFWLDDDYRINPLSVVFGGGGVRIVEGHTVYQEPVRVLAWRQINSTYPPVNFFRAVVLSLDPVVERSVDSHSLGVGMPRQLKGCIAGDTRDGRRHLLNPNISRLTI